MPFWGLKGLAVFCSYYLFSIKMNFLMHPNCRVFENKCCFVSIKSELFIEVLFSFALFTKKFLFLSSVYLSLHSVLQFVDYKIFLWKKINVISQQKDFPAKKCNSPIKGLTVWCIKDTLKVVSVTGSALNREQWLCF